MSNTAKCVGSTQKTFPNYFSKIWWKIIIVKLIGCFSALIVKFLCTHFCVKLSAEFKRITTVGLLPKFFSELDAHLSKLLKVFGKKGGAQGRKIKSILMPMTQVKQRGQTAKRITVKLTF